MARNTLLDLNNHLFEQIERLNDDELDDDQLAKEIERSKAMNQVAKTIIDNANTVLSAERLKLSFGNDFQAPEMLEHKKR